jgi:gluconokinase
MNAKKPPRVIVIMGVTGTGKSTIGELLAKRHGGRYFDADDFHPPANVEKMSGGTPLNDEDRLPWLQRLRSEVIDSAPEDQLTLLACSALKRAYRDLLGLDREGIRTVYLHGHPSTLLERLESRSGHYMKAEMLDSQLEAMEVPSPQTALHVPVTLTPGQIVELIEEKLF